MCLEDAADEYKKLARYSDAHLSFFCWSFFFFSSFSSFLFFFSFFSFLSSPFFLFLSFLSFLEPLKSTYLFIREEHSLCVFAAPCLKGKLSEVGLLLLFGADPATDCDVLDESDEDGDKCKEFPLSKRSTTRLWRCF